MAINVRPVNYKTLYGGHSASLGNCKDNRFSVLCMSPIAVS